MLYLAEQAFVNAVMLGFVYMVVALGLSIVFGVLDIVNFAHGSLMISGAYIVYVVSLFFRNDLAAVFVGMVPAIVILAGIGVLVYTCYLRFFDPSDSTRQLFGLVALAGIVENALLMIFGPANVSLSSSFKYYFVGGLAFNALYVYAALVSVAFTALVFLFLYRSDFGLMMRATAENRTAAQLCGVNVGFTFMIALMLGFALTGGAGAIIASYYSFTPASGLTFVVIAFLSVVLGGLGNLKGTLLGAFIVALIQNFVSAFASPQLVNLVLFLVFTLIVATRPQGILGGKA